MPTELTMEELLVKYHELEAKHEAVVKAQTADRLVIGDYNGNPTVQIIPHGKRPWTMGVSKFLNLIENADKWGVLYDEALLASKAK